MKVMYVLTLGAVLIGALALNAKAQTWNDPQAPQWQIVTEENFLAFDAANKKAYACREAPKMAVECTNIEVIWSN